MSNTLKDNSEVDQLASDEEYVEEEVTDDEEGEEEGEQEKPEVVGAPSPSTGSIVNVAAQDEPMEVSKKRTPAVSDAVKNVISSSPGASASRSGPAKKGGAPSVSLNSTGSWTPETFANVNIVFPTIGVNNETTNDLTRATRPENRYWKGDIKFSLNGENTQTIRIFNVPIPYSEGSKYGVDFVYMALPGYMGDQFAEVGKRKRPTVVNEKSLMPDSERWWKIANNIGDKFGYGDPVKKSFKPISLQTLFGSTAKGLIANVELKFTARCSTTDSAKLLATNPQRITVDLVRAYIMSMDQDIELPARVAKAVATVKPGAAKQDFATDEVMKRLKDLGL